jgi:hypothetical protein
MNALEISLFSNAFKVGKADPTLFTKTCDGDFLYAKYMLMTYYLVLLTKSHVQEF